MSGFSLPRDVAIQLWAGVDLRDEELDQILEKATDVKREGVNGAASQPVAILGAPDSGTNLIESTLLTNFIQGTKKDLKRLVFKHSISTAKDLCERYNAHSVPDNFTVIVVIRSPISQLVSWHKAPYFLAPCTDRGFDEMGAPCFANVSPEWNCHNMSHKDDGHLKNYPGRSVNFRNTMDIYNRYLKQYKEMLSNPACRRINVHLIRYEDMVFTPDTVMEELARKAGWPVPSTINIVDSPAKAHGEPVGRSLAMGKIDGRSYLQELNAPDLAARCKELDAHLVRDQFEKSFLGDRISYLKDCQIAA